MRRAIRWCALAAIVICLCVIVARIDALFAPLIFNHDPNRDHWLEMQPKAYWYAFLEMSATIVACAVAASLARALLRDRAEEDAWRAREREWAEQDRIADFRR